MSAQSTTPQRRRAGALGAVASIALVLLALSVFAVASQSRTVTDRAEAGVQAVENLRVLTLARSELASASRLAAAAPEQALAIEAGLVNTQTALDDVTSNLSDVSSVEILSALEDFRVAVALQISEIRAADDDPEALQQREIDTGQAFTALSDLLRAEQVRAIGDLEADNDLMNFIATAASFIVALVVPAAGLLVFQRLRREPRKLREVELSNEHLWRRSEALSTTLVEDGQRLLRAMDGSDTPIETADVHRHIVRFINMGRLHGAATTTRNEVIDANQVVHEAIGILDLEENVTINASRTTFAFADPVQLGQALHELLVNAVEHGSDPFEVEISTEQSLVKISISDGGPGLPDRSLEALVESSDYRLRQRAESGGFGFGIVTARHALERMGGSLSYARADDRTIFVVSVALATDPS